MTEDTRCVQCGHDPATRNNSQRECSHPDCQHRKRYTATPGVDFHGDTAPGALLCMFCLRGGHYAADCPQAAKARKHR